MTKIIFSRKGFDSSFGGGRARSCTGRPFASHTYKTADPSHFCGLAAADPGAGPAFDTWKARSRTPVPFGSRLRRGCGRSPASRLARSARASSGGAGAPCQPARGFRRPVSVLGSLQARGQSRWTLEVCRPTRSHHLWVAASGGCARKSGRRPQPRLPLARRTSAHTARLGHRQHHFSG